MKSILLSLSLFLPLAASPAQAVLTVFENNSGDGFWGTPSNWSGGEVPGATDNAVVNGGAVATVATNAPFVDIVTVGNGPVAHTALSIQADLTTDWLRVSWSAGARGAIYQSNGVVTVNDGFQIASTSSGAESGIYTIYDGALTFPTVRLDVGTLGQGSFTIDGSLPSFIGGQAMTLGEQATLTFELDMMGVTPMTLTGTCTVDASSRLVVDGTDYEALDGYFPLVRSPSLTGGFDPANVTFIGFEERKPALVVQSDGLWLRTIAPPAWSDRLLSLVPDSTVAADYSNTHFSVSRTLEPSGSAWAISLNEAHVMDARLTQDVLGSGPGQSNRSWDLRVGRGGFIYSLRTPALGETVPPQWRSSNSSDGSDASPWNDEVWQGVSVSSSNDPPESPYFMHQSGVYWKQDQLDEPYYSPQVSAEVDLTNRSFTTINWTPQAHVKVYADASTENDWKSYQLVYTRYRDLGQGLIEVTLGNYNYGPDLINWMNMPWGGVRRTSTEYAFLSETNGTNWAAAHTGSFFRTSSQAATRPVELNDTGGWVGFSASEDGSTPSLGVVFGHDSDPLPANSRGPSWYRRGYTCSSRGASETNWRNYYVSSNVRRYNLSQGNGIWSRSYFVLGDDLTDVASRIAERGVVDVELREFNYQEPTTPQIGYSLSGSGKNFRIVKNSCRPDFFLYAHPVARSFPIFEIIRNDRSRYLTWNPYANGIVRPYDGSLAGIRLLGFALRSQDVNSVGICFYAYAPVTTVMGAVPDNYVSDGEELAVRVPSAIHDWRLEHFGCMSDSGVGAAGADPDEDGVANLLEYAFGGDPNNQADIGYFPQMKAYPSGSVYVYGRRRDAFVGCLNYRIETTTDLQASAWKTRGVRETGTSIVDADFEMVTNQVDSAETVFMRIHVDSQE